jgi:branched-chain amino acid transport system substrate-binding protein
MIERLNGQYFIPNSTHLKRRRYMKQGRITGLGWLICLFLVIIAMPSTSAFAAPASQGKPIKIGVLVPMTGASAETGPKMKNAITLRFEEAKWQVAGRPMEMIIQDEGGGDPAFAMAAVKKMVEMDQVDIVIGPMNTPMTMAVAPYLARQQIVTLTLAPVAGDAKMLSNLFKGWIFTTGGEGGQFCFPFGEFAYNDMKFRTITTVSQDHAAGKRFMGTFVEGFKSKGGTVVQQQWVPYGTADMGPYLSVLKDVDALALWLIPIDIRRFLKQYDERGLFKKMPIVIPRAGVIDEVALKELGDLTLGLVAEQNYVNLLDTQVNKKFVAGYKSKYGVPPDFFCATAYQAASVALAGFEATKGDATRDKLRQAIVSLKLETPTGNVSFTPSGLAILDTYFVEVKKKGGEYIFEPIKKRPATRPLGE